MTLMRWDGVIHWGPKRMEILEVYMTLGQVKVWARNDLALVSKDITATCILDCVRSVSLTTCVNDVTIIAMLALVTMFPTDLSVTP